MKKFIRLLLTALVATAITASLAACNDGNGGGNGTAGTYAGFVSIDINPSVEFTVGEDGKITSVRAMNADAEVLLADTNLTGLTVEQAAKTVTELAEKMGYLSESNKKVKILTAADSAETEAKLAEEASTGAQAGSDIAEVTDSAAALEREVRKLQEQNAELYKDLTPAKLRLIKSIMKFDKTMTVEKGSAMTVAQLADELKDAHEEYAELVTDELKEKYDKLEDELEAQIESAIAKLYGEEFSELTDKKIALENAENEFERQLENAEITDDDVAAIAEILGVENTAVFAGEDGAITVKSLEAYLENIEDKYDDTDEEDAFEDALDEAEEILEKYDDDEAALTVEMLEKLAKIDPDCTAKTLEELDDYIDEIEDRLDDMKDRVNLSQEVKAQIAELEKSVDELEKRIKEEMKTLIAEAKAELKAAKDALLKS